MAVDVECDRYASMPDPLARHLRMDASGEQMADVAVSQNRETALRAQSAGTAPRASLTVAVDSVASRPGGNKPDRGRPKAGPPGVDPGLPVAMPAHPLDGYRGQGDGAARALCLRGLEDEPSSLDFLEGSCHRESTAIEVDILPTEPEDLASPHAVVTASSTGA